MKTSITLKKNSRLLSKIFCSVCIALAIACFASCEKGGSNSGGTDDPGTDPGTGGGETPAWTMQQVALAGVVRSLDGNPLSGVTVTTGSNSVTTNADGKFIFTEVGVVDKRVVLKFEKSGYFTLVRSNVKAGEIYLEAILQAKSAGDYTLSTSFAATAEKTLTVKDLKVKFPASSIVTADGSSYTGTVKADVFYLEPNNENWGGLMPGGDLSAVRSNGSEAQLISYGMVDVVLTDNSGNPLQLKTGSEAEITFPIPEGMDKNPPSTIPLWHFDETKGLWTEYGQAALQGNVYVGVTSHFSWINVDYPEATGTVKGKIKNKKKKPIGMDGKTGETTGTTGGTGDGTGGGTDDGTGGGTDDGTDDTDSPITKIKVSLEYGYPPDDPGDPIQYIYSTDLYPDSEGQFSIAVPADMPGRIVIQVWSSDSPNCYWTEVYLIPATAAGTTVNLDIEINFSQDPCSEHYDWKGEASVVIDGLRWATCNVNAPGVFADKPGDPGMFYQWGSKVGWSSSDPLANTDGSSWITDSDYIAWESANDPCPAGWRVPTSEELQNLTYTSVSSWGTSNGVPGRIFGSAPNALFLPAAGYRNGTTTAELIGLGLTGNYWSTSLSLGGGGGGSLSVDDGYHNNSGYYLNFSDSNADVSFGRVLESALSIRCVTDN